MDVINPAIAIDKQPDSLQVVSGGSASFALEVTNAGDVPLSDVVVADAECDAAPAYQSGDTNADGNLDLTETWTYTCSIANVGDTDFDNIATADADDPNGDPVPQAEDTTPVDVVQPPKLTVIKHVVNNNDGKLVASHFDITVSGTAVPGDTTFPGEEDPGTTLVLVPGNYEVTETDAFALFYSAVFTGDCSGTLEYNDVKTCTITNDDIFQKNQPSLEVSGLTAALDNTREEISGQFVIDDASGDDIFILLTDYDVDWEYRLKGKWQDSDPTDPPGIESGGWLKIDGTHASYECIYTIDSIDQPFDSASYQSGDPVIFDEQVIIGYSCTYDSALPNTGTLRGTASSGISFRDKLFEFKESFNLGIGGI